ncbi:hypothetical protein J3F84DRAFT_361894 [Trichoderma pleuroticola]
MEAASLVKQEIQSQYIDLKLLALKLKQLFPNVKCKVVPKGDDITIIYVPRLVMEEEELSFMTVTD